MLDCCEQSWCFHGGRGGGACKDRSIAHTNCSLPVIWKSEREWGKKLLHSVTEKHTHKKKWLQMEKEESVGRAVAIETMSQAGSSH